VFALHVVLTAELVMHVLRPTSVPSLSDKSKGFRLTLEWRPARVTLENNSSQLRRSKVLLMNLHY
jgi:hypothetical protein